MFNYQIINFSKFEINEKIIKKIFSKIQKIIIKKQSGTLNIVFVTPKEIQIFNKNYRNIDEITDVLSFGYFENFDKVKKDDIAGELIFCEEKIVDQAKEYGLGEEKEFYKLLIHSVLHILGFDHEKDHDYKIMQEFENKIWQEIFEK